MPGRVPTRRPVAARHRPVDRATSPAGWTSPTSRSTVRRSRSAERTTGSRSRRPPRTAPSSCPAGAPTSSSTSTTPASGCSPAGATCRPDAGRPRRTPAGRCHRRRLHPRRARRPARRRPRPSQHVDALPGGDRPRRAGRPRRPAAGRGRRVGRARRSQVWLGTEDPAVIRSVSAALTGAGLPGHVDHHRQRGAGPVRPLGHRVGPAARGVHRLSWRCSCPAWSSGWSPSRRGAGWPATSPAFSWPGRRAPCCARPCAASS